ncbi:SGNH/GDSL hydrolase family protein [Streptomyces sp. 1331.2]|uniref:SGNH/GDSL hydrolase family protein n=1 Tax=Streptomyces sp. 1331.2 TaxID=1938835 RepID=UPI000BCA7B2D|nr:SGNH/GDSL hydrolase family protein [Streptomyces sp. 1331.2]SOB84181.1 GDSL-like Lipase/Acylhydrolase family protein [Streptomyces sp. 1331.2]
MTATRPAAVTSGPAATTTAVEWLTPEDPRLSWDGINGLARRDDRWIPLRLPLGRVATTLSGNFARLAELPVGARFGFRTDAVELTLELDAEPGSAPLDVVVDGVVAHRWHPVPGRHRLTLPLPSGTGAGTGTGTDADTGGPAEVEVWLPHLSRTWLGRLSVRGHRVLEPVERTGPRWVAYGSSLTHAMFPHGPSESWVSLVAVRHGWRLRNLGFAGEAYLDPLVARIIRDTPAELITLEIGTNAYIRNVFTARSWGSAVCGFVETIRDGHPDTPIAVIAALPSVEREKVVNAAGLTLEGIRELTGEAVRVLQQLGDRRLHLVDGRDVLPIADADRVYADGLHPTPDGEHDLADRAAPILKGIPLG